jgi:hypothetical protein
MYAKFWSEFKRSVKWERHRNSTSGSAPHCCKAPSD